MKINGIDAMELQVAEYYIHEESRTMWHPTEISQARGIPTMTVELKNMYGDQETLHCHTNIYGIFAKDGTFRKITKAEWDDRK